MRVLIEIEQREMLSWIIAMKNMPLGGPRNTLKKENPRKLPRQITINSISRIGEMDQEMGPRIAARLTREVATMLQTWEI